MKTQNYIEDGLVAAHLFDYCQYNYTEKEHVASFNAFSNLMTRLGIDMVCAVFDKVTTTEAVTLALTRWSPS